MDQYINFGVEDFVWDSFFRTWVLTPTRESDAAWNNWLLQNPETRSLVDQAKQIVLSLQINEPHLSDQEINAVVKKTISKITQP